MDRSWEDVDFRTYRHIFADENTSSPGDNIGLGYTSPYLEMTFNPGEDTIFHFPVVPKEFKYEDDIRYTSGISINDSGLLENGAIPGRAPYCSDRVYLNNVDYEWKDAGGGARPKNMANGVWLCAWLSGDVSDIDSAKWVDRWYDPEIIDSRAAGIADAEANGVYDVESRITFRYGCQYIYHRVSKADFEFFVDTVDSSGLILRINDWTSAGCYNTAPATSAEFTIRMNNTTPDMFGSCEVVPDSGDTGISFNGKSTVTVDSASGNQQGREFSIVSFVQHNDWENCTKGAIIDRGIRGGWEIGVSPKPYNNLICVLGTEKQTNMNSISIYGPSFNLVSTAKFSEGNKVIRVAVDDDYGIWGLRKSDIVRIDINANITQSCPLPSGMAGYLAANKRKIEDVTLQMLGGDLYGKMAVVCGPASEKASDGKSEIPSDTLVYTFDLTKCEFDDGSTSAGASAFEGKDDSTGYQGINQLISNTARDGCSSWAEKESRFKFYRRQSVTDIDDELAGLNKLVLDDDELPFDVKVDADYNIFVMTKKYKVIGTDKYGNPIFYYRDCPERSPQYLTLSGGWNVISFDQLPDDPSPEVVFSSILPNVKRVICGGDSWIPDGSGNTLDKIEFGKAYMVFVDAPDSVPFNLDWENTNPGVEIKCNPGWTLVGYPFSDKDSIISVMRDVLMSEKITKIASYDTGEMWGVEGGTLTEFEPNKAYWMYSETGCTFSFDCGTGIGMTTPTNDGRCEIVGGRLLKFIKDRDGHFYQRKIVTLPVSEWSRPAGIVVSSYSKNGKNITVVNAVMTDGYIIRYSTDLERLWTTNISYYSENIHTVVNGYEWGRRFLNNVLYARVLIGPNPEVLLNPGKRFLLSTPIERDASDASGRSKGLSNRDWHQVAFVRDRDGFKLYLDSTEVDGVAVPEDKQSWGIMYVANPNIVIGGDCGVGAELYEEHNMMDLFWNGNMDDLRIYNMAVTQQDLQHIHMSKYDVQPMHWNMPVYNRFYVETIARFYKMKKPGSKAQNYDIVVNGYTMKEDSEEFAKVKSELGGYVKDALPEIAPAYTKGGRVVFKNMNGGWNGH